MKDLNYTYGVLSCNKVKDTDKYYRYSTVHPNKVQLIELNKLFEGIPDSNIGAVVELLIQLIRSSELWPAYIKNYDELNTYNRVFYVKPDSSLFTYDRLAKWADSCMLSSDKYPTYEQEDKLTTIIKKLYTVLEANG